MRGFRLSFGEWARAIMKVSGMAVATGCADQCTDLALGPGCTAQIYLLPDCFDYYFTTQCFKFSCFSQNQGKGPQLNAYAGHKCWSGPFLAFPNKISWICLDNALDPKDGLLPPGEKYHSREALQSNPSRLPINWEMCFFICFSTCRRIPLMISWWPRVHILGDILHSF